MISNESQHIAMLPLGPVSDDLQPLFLEASLLRAAKACIEACEEQFTSPYQRDQTALLVAASGEFNPDVNANLAKLSRMLWEGLGFGWATIGFTGSTWPPILVGLKHMRLLGFRRIIVFPCPLFPDNQIYSAALRDALHWEHSDVTVVLARALDTYSVTPQAEVEKGIGLHNCFQCSYRSAHTHDATPPAANPPKHHHP